MNAHRFAGACLTMLLMVPAAGNAQRVESPGNQAGAIQSDIAGFSVKPAAGFEVIESAPLESMALVRNAPFSADAVTEFTQILGDGNRIERRYASSIARDSRGRTRREEEIAMVGPLAGNGPTPRLVTILDPVDGVSYTLDANLRIAHRNRMAAGRFLEYSKAIEAGTHNMRVAIPPPIANQKLSVEENLSASKVVTEKLGTRTIEGVAASGTRTTMTIPAGAIGNLQPIEVVSERWFSPEVQMAVLITRRDPRAGETVYRLANIVRAEPPDDLFSVPPGYDIREGKLSFNFLRKVEAVKEGEIRKKK